MKSNKGGKTLQEIKNVFALKDNNSGTRGGMEGVEELELRSAGYKEGGVTPSKEP